MQLWLLKGINDAISIDKVMFIYEVRWYFINFLCRELKMYYDLSGSKNRSDPNNRQRSGRFMRNDIAAGKGKPAGGTAY